MGDFAQKMGELASRVGSGDLEGSVEYDQVYAQYQHEGLGLRHPQGGQAKFLESAMQSRFTQYLERVSKDVLTDGGVDAMVKAVEDLADASSDRAPIGGPADRAAGHPGLLKASAHPKVTSGGAVVYDRPGAPRQTDAERDTTPGSEARRGGRR